MKEKTFEELIEEESNIKLVDESDWNNIQFSALDMREFGKQVREATITEVLKLCDDNFFSKEGKLMENIENIQTDRIKLTEKK